MKKITMLLTNAFLPDPRPHREALSLARAGYSVKILCWDRGEGLAPREVIDGIAVERIRVASRHGRGPLQIVFLLQVWCTMAARVFKDMPDLVWCHDFDTLPAGIIIKKCKGNKLVFDSHEVFSKMLGGNVPAFLKKFIAILERWLIKYADMIIVTCAAMRDFYAFRGAANILVVGNQKDPAVFQIPPEMLDGQRSILGIGGELVISYIANLGPERIIAPLLDIVKDDSGLFLIIGGDGCQKPLVEAAARDCRRIKYLGYVPHDRVPLYTALADVVYYGYDKNSGMAEYCNPNKLFEALAAGRAFLGGDFGEMGKIIKEEGCGIALAGFTRESIQDAVAILKDRKRLEEFKANARTAGASKYNWQHVEKNLLGAVVKMESN